MTSEDDDLSAPLSNESRKIVLAACNQLAIRRAAVVAATSADTKSASVTSTQEVLRNSRQVIEFNRIAINAELEFLEIMGVMDEVELVVTLFFLFDKDNSGTIDVGELASGLGKVDRNNAYADSLDVAIKYVNAFDNDSNAGLDQNEFFEFLKEMMASMDCELHEVAEFLVLKIAFSDGGDAIIEDAVRDQLGHGDDLENAAEFFNEMIVEARMMLIFQLLDTEQQGDVAFADVVKHLFRFIKSVDPNDESPVSNLLMLDNEGENRRLNFDDFYVLILNVETASPSSVKFNDLANAFTWEACQKREYNDADMRELFMTDDLRKAAEEMGYSEAVEKEAVNLLDYGRMTRLFNLWDLDHNGTIDFSELMLGMRKFHEAKAIESTLDDCVAALQEFDSDGDQVLDKKEFAGFLVKFAKTTNVPLHELIDFMVVQSAMRDNDEEEKAYVASIKETRRGKQSGQPSWQITNKVNSWFRKKDEEEGGQ